MKGNTDGLTSKNLVRIHPNEAGKTVDFGGQRFVGVSPDIFIGLDSFDSSNAYIITRKFNISIKINPKLWSSGDFFRFLTEGQSVGSDPFKTKALEKVEKCSIHGDDETNLRAHANLKALLCQADLNQLSDKTGGFKVNDAIYAFHSIGVAANEDYAPVCQRNTSHFEIKFQRQGDLLPLEFLCLNIHLMAELDRKFDQEAVMNRLNQGIRLFYAELGVLKKPFHPQTRLKDAMGITLDNFERQHFSCIHTESLNVLEAHHEAKAHTLSPNRVRQPIQLSAFWSPSTGASKADSGPRIVSAKTYGLVAKTGLSDKKSSNAGIDNSDFWSNERDFPSLGASKKPSMK